jgi:hypothetical protein
MLGNRRKTGDTSHVRNAEVLKKTIYLQIGARYYIKKMKLIIHCFSLEIVVGLLRVVSWCSRWGTKLKFMPDLERVIIYVCSILFLCD